MSGTPVRSSAQLFTVAAERVTRLLKSPDHNHFCQAANAVTALYREQESQIARAQHRGARESLRECLQWVTAQGPTVDTGQLAQLLKQQIEVHSAKAESSEAGSTVLEEAPARFESFLPEDNWAGLLSMERSTASGGNAMEETPDAGARKRKGDDLFLSEDERLLQALPAVWPRKTMRRLNSMYSEGGGGGGPGDRNDEGILL